MKLTNVSEKFKISLGKITASRIAEYEEELNEGSLIELGNIFLKAINHNKMDKISENTAKDIQQKYIIKPEQLKILEQKKEESRTEYTSMKETWPNGILDSAYTNPDEYINENVNSQLYKFGIFSANSESQALQVSQELIKKHLEFFLIKDGNYLPYAHQLALLAEAVSLYNGQDLLGNIKAIQAKITTKYQDKITLTQFQKMDLVKDLEKLIKEEVIKIGNSSLIATKSNKF